MLTNVTSGQDTKVLGKSQTTIYKSQVQLNTTQYGNCNSSPMLANKTNEMVVSILSVSVNWLTAADSQVTPQKASSFAIKDDVRTQNTEKEMVKGRIKLVTWARNSSVSFGGSFFESPATLPRRMSLTDTFLTLNPTLSPGLASSRAVWCISTDFTSVVTFTGANVTIMPAFRVPVSTRPTGTVPIPEYIHPRLNYRQKLTEQKSNHSTGWSVSLTFCLKHARTFKHPHLFS